MAGMLARAVRRVAWEQVEHVSAVRPQAARGRVAEVYAQLERDFGMLAPPVILHSPAPEILAAAWVMLRETLVATGKGDRAAKEAVAAAVSHGNACPYCVDVHGTALHGLLRGGDAAAVAAGRPDAIGDPYIRAVVAWANAPTAHPRPFPADQAAELVGVAVVFHYLNRVVNVFLGDSPLPRPTARRSRTALMAVVGRLLRSSTRSFHEPGTSLDLLPAAVTPADLAWADGSPVVAAALARSAAAFDAGGERAVPAAVRAVVEAELAGWDGRPPGLGRGWVDGALAGLHADQRPLGRLALLTAMASYQVDRSVIDESRRAGAGDGALVELVAWAAFAAARRRGGAM